MSARAAAGPNVRRWGLWSLYLHAVLIAGSIVAFATVVGRAPPSWIPPELWGRTYGVGMQWVGATYILAGFVAALGAWVGAVGTRRGLATAALVVGLSLGLELLGTSTGVPFGPYSYGDALGYRVLGLVPWPIPLSWFTLTYAALALSMRMGFGRWGTVLWTAVALVAWDVLMDPAMSLAFPFWSWEVDGAYFGMPLLNWAGWFLTGLILATAIESTARSAEHVLTAQRMPLWLYLLNGIFPFALALEAGAVAAAFIGAAAMGAVLTVTLGSIPDRFMALRDRILASPGFQRWAGTFPLTRPIAVHRARRVFDLCSGFVFSQTLLACLRLDLFDTLAAGPRSAEDLARSWGVDPSAARSLLEAARAVDLVQHRREGRYGLGTLGAPLVGNEAVRAMAEHNLLLYRDLEDPLCLLRKNGDGGTHLRRYWPYARHDAPADLSPDQVALYSELMTRSNALVADEVLRRYPFGRHERVLDVGAGEAIFAERLLAAFHHLQVTAFDLPGVAERARRRLAAKAGGGRLQVVSGDFFRDPLPGGMDLVTLLRVVHDHDDDEAVTLLRNVNEALKPGGRVLVAEPMAGTPGSERVGAAYFSWYLLAMGAGRPRTPRDLTALLQAAGFRDVRSLFSSVPVQTGLLVARR